MSWVQGIVVKPINLVLMEMNCIYQIWNETDERAKGAAKALYEIYEVVTHDLLSSDLRFMVCYILISI